MQKITHLTIRKQKQEKKPITMITAYDVLMAKKCR